MAMDKPDIKPLLISHRGAHKEAPENSCEAFEIAMDYGVDGIETDLQLSRDGIPVLFHNPTAYHVTGSRKRISAYTGEQLQALDLGQKGAFVGIPTLAEMLTSFSQRTRLLIEIKSRKPDRVSGRSTELTDKVVSAITCLPEGIQANIYILSFDPDVLARASQAAPQLQYVLNTDGTGDWCVPVANLMRGEPALDFLAAICLERKILSKEVVIWARKRGLKVFTYCCNTRYQVAQALDLGVDGIMSDKPGWLVGLFKPNA